SFCATRSWSGPASIQTVAPVGLWINVASPCPMSRNRAVMFEGGPDPSAVDHTTSGSAATAQTTAGRGSRLPERSHHATTTKTAPPITRTDGPPPVVIHATGAFAMRLATKLRYPIGVSTKSQTTLRSESQTTTTTEV